MPDLQRVTVVDGIGDNWGNRCFIFNMVRRSRLSIQTIPCGTAAANVGAPHIGYTS
jgi:hypothetical protein